MSKFNNDTGYHVLDLALAELNDSGVGSNWSISSKRKSLRKFGRNENLSTGAIATVWQNGTDDEVYLSPADGNLIDTISSSSVADVGQFILIEGHYWVGTDLIFSIQRVVLNGQNKVTLTRPICRTSRAYELATVAPTGDISVYEDTAIVGGVPTDLTKRHVVIKGTLGQVQSYKAATSVSSTDALIITSFSFGVNRSQAAAIDFTLEDRNAGGNLVFTPSYGRIGANSIGTTTFRANLDPPVKILPNHDVRVRAISSANNVAANATFSGYLATKVA